MRKYIHLMKADRDFIAKAFGVSARTVYNATHYEGCTADDTAKRIRKLAMERGGVVMVVVPEMETIHDADGYMRQVFPNGAMLEINKATGAVVLTLEGDKVTEFENVTIDRLQHLQTLAAALNRGNVELMKA